MVYKKKIQCFINFEAYFFFHYICSSVEYFFSFFFLLSWLQIYCISYSIFTVQFLTHFPYVDSIQQHFLIGLLSQQHQLTLCYWMLSPTFLVYMFSVKKPSPSFLFCSSTSVLVTQRFCVINIQPTKTIEQFIFQSTVMFFMFILSAKGGFVSTQAGCSYV